MFVVQSDNLDLLKLLIDNGPDVHYCNSLGCDALWYTSYASSGLTEILKYLRECGITLNHTDNNGGTCLHCPAFFGYFNQYQQLLDLGIDSSIRNADGKTAIDLLFQSNIRTLFGIDKRVRDSIHLIFLNFAELTFDQRLEHERDIFQICVTTLKIKEIN